MGGKGGPDPLNNHKALGFLSYSGPDPLKNHKAIPSQHSMLGHFNGISLTGRRVISASIFRTVYPFLLKILH